MVGRIMVLTAVVYEQRQQYREAYARRSKYVFAGYSVSILEERMANRNQYPGSLLRLFKSGSKRERESSRYSEFQCTASET
jgi:hypothetical protein